MGLTTAMYAAKALPKNHFAIAHKLHKSDFQIGLTTATYAAKALPENAHCNSTLQLHKSEFFKCALQLRRMRQKLNPKMHFSIAHKAV